MKNMLVAVMLTVMRHVQSIDIQHLSSNGYHFN